MDRLFMPCAEQGGYFIFGFYFATYTFFIKVNKELIFVLGPGTFDKAGAEQSAQRPDTAAHSGRPCTGQFFPIGSTPGAATDATEEHFPQL
jgi:hypothetical protein